MKQLSILSIAVALLAAAATTYAEAPMESSKPIPECTCMGHCGCGADCAPGKCPKPMMKCACPMGCMTDGKCMEGCSNKCAKAQKSCSKETSMKSACKKGMDMAQKCCAKMGESMKGCCAKMGEAMKSKCSMGEAQNGEHSQKRFHYRAYRK